MRKFVFLIITFFTISIIESAQRASVSSFAVGDVKTNSTKLSVIGGGIVGRVQDPYIFQGVFEGYGKNPEIVPYKMACYLQRALQSYVAGPIHTHDFNESSNHVSGLFTEAIRSTLRNINDQKKTAKEISAVLAYYNFVTQNIAIINFGGSAIISQKVGDSQEYVQEKRNLEELASGVIRSCYTCSFFDDRLRPVFSPRLVLIGTNKLLEEVKDGLCTLYKNNSACSEFQLKNNIELLQGFSKTYQKGIISAFQLRSCLSCPLTPKEDSIIQCLRAFRRCFVGK